MANARRNPERGRNAARRYAAERTPEERLRRILYLRNWRLLNPEKSRRRKPVNREQARRYSREWWRKRLSTPEGKLEHRLRAAMHRVFRGKLRPEKALQIIGCSIEELRDRFTLLLAGTQMTWENMGYWEIDHIIPVSKFDHADPVQVRACWHYSNLQPLPKIENRRKRDKILPEVLSVTPVPALVSA